MQQTHEQSRREEWEFSCQERVDVECRQIAEIIKMVKDSPKLPTLKTIEETEGFLLRGTYDHL